MAYLPGRTTTQQDDEEDKLLQPQLVQGGVAPSVDTAGSATGPQGGGATGSGFTNFQRYIQALQPQAGRLAGSIASGIEEGAGQRFGEQVSGVQQDYTGQVGGATVKQDSDLVGQAIGQAGTTGAVDEPTAAQVEALRTADYTGPGSFQDAGLRTGLEEGIASETAQAESDVSSREGREKLLRGVSRKTTTPGMTSLDQYLLQAAPGSRKTFSELGGKVGAQLQARLDTAAQGARDEAEVAKATTQETRRATQEQLTGAAETGGTDRTKSISERSASLSALIQGGKPITATQILEAGITPEDYATYMSGVAAAETANTGSAFGRDVDPNQIITDYLNSYMSGNFNANAFVEALQGAGMAPADVDAAFNLLETQAGVRHGSLRGTVPGWRGGTPDTADINIAGQTFDPTAYMQDGSVGATEDERAQYQALQALAGVGSGQRQTLTDQSALFDALGAGAAASGIEAQQSQAVMDEQARRNEVLRSFVGSGSTAPPPPVTRVAAPSYPTPPSYSSNETYVPAPTVAPAPVAPAPVTRPNPTQAITDLVKRFSRPRYNTFPVVQ